MFDSILSFQFILEDIYLFSSLWMVVVILFVQLVHYPLFKYIPLESLRQFSLDHQARISLLVVPAMLCEFFSLFFLMLVVKIPFFYVSFLILVIIWLITFLVQVPIHRQLISNPSLSLAVSLEKGNWFRTILWCVKAIFIIIYYI